MIEKKLCEICFPSYPFFNFIFYLSKQVDKIIIISQRSLCEIRFFSSSKGSMGRILVEGKNFKYYNAGEVGFETNDLKLALMGRNMLQAVLKLVVNSTNLRLIFEDEDKGNSVKSHIIQKIDDYDKILDEFLRNLDSMKYDFKIEIPYVNFSNLLELSKKGHVLELLINDKNVELSTKATTLNFPRSVATFIGVKKEKIEKEISHHSIEDLWITKMVNNIYFKDYISLKNLKLDFFFKEDLPSRIEFPLEILQMKFLLYIAPRIISDVY